MVKLEGGGGAQICTQQDGIYVPHMICDDEMMKKMMMAQGDKDPKHTSQVVLVKRIIMKHDNPVRITHMTQPSQIQRCSVETHPFIHSFIHWSVRSLLI